MRMGNKAQPRMAAVVGVVGLTLAAGAALPAAAQPSPAAQAVWDRFADVCPKVVAANNPAVFAATLYDEGGVGQSIDGAVLMSNQVMYDLDVDAQVALLITYVNVFDEGRGVQCMLQLVGAEDPLDGLGDLARAQAGGLLGEDATLTMAGGPVIGTESAAMLEELDGAEIVRVSTQGFPPDGVVSVQVLPQVTILILNVVQPAEE